MRNSERDDHFEAGNTERVTKFGAFLRKYKLDELPQFFNVIKGDLSIVGPRPETEYWVNATTPHWNEILKLRPGITDNASILFSNEESQLQEASDPISYYKRVILPKKIMIYKEYVNKNTFWGDILIIIKTLKKIIIK